MATNPLEQFGPEERSRAPKETIPARKMGVEAEPPLGLSSRETALMDMVLEDYRGLSEKDIMGEKAVRLGKQIAERIQNLGFGHKINWNEVRRYVGDKYVGTGLGVIAEKIRFGITEEESKNLAKRKAAGL